MKIAEVFHSLQGEGILAGVPSGFIRFAGCNLRCAWCDTRHASWRPEPVERTLESVVAEVAAYPSRHVVVTGGEPTIHPELPDLTHALRTLGRHVTLETNGTVFREGVACDLVSISPKLAHSVPDPAVFPDEARLQAGLRSNPDAVRRWLDACDCQLKFVVAATADIAEVRAFVARLDRRIPADRVLLMPEGTDARRLHRVIPDIVAACKEHGYRYGARLHIELFGNRRGT